MNGLLEKLRRGAIRALGGYVELVPPPKPQDRALIKEERYRVRKIEVRAMPFDNRPRAEELLQRYKKYSSERLADMLAKKMLESVEALKLSMMGKAIAEIKEFNGLPVDRLRELAEADKDGRLVVLPCKVGDTVYLIVTKRARNYTPEFRFVKKSRLTFLNMERILQDFGKEAFLTREEAEKTLEAMK
jgi:hypothetical protein|nr:MAG TPA: hypothetical protein [Caudoviricetes sp.]